jgi:hypothetical protein
MKRFHVHLHVADLAGSIGFYSRMFDAQPAKQHGDYAKWMLDDPPLNFAISSRGGTPGVDHLGIQAGDEDELATLKQRAASADSALFDEGRTSCCYARSDKHWVTDPQGVAWEQFHTLADIPTFGAAKPDSGEAACCAAAAAPAEAEPSAAKACC